MDRDPEDCPHRREIPGDESRFTCGYISDSTGVSPGDPITRVDRDACLSCCRWPVPESGSANPWLASLLFNAAQKLRLVPGPKDDTRIGKIESLAIRHLDSMPGNIIAETVIRKNSHCSHLGEQKGTRLCTTCPGNVRLKVYACSHPGHLETTIRECRTCPDFEDD